MANALERLKIAFDGMDILVDLEASTVPKGSMPKPKAQGTRDDSVPSSELGLPDTPRQAQAPSDGGEDAADRPRQFCPWALLMNYAKLFLDKESSKKARSFFKLENMLDDRTWDFFYLYHPREPMQFPTIFVPMEQYESYLDFVNDELETSLNTPPGKKAEYVHFTFGEFGTPKPHPLGQTTSFQEWEKLIEEIPGFCSRDVAKGVSEQFLDDFIEKLEMIERVSVGEDADKQKAKKKAKAREKRIRTRVETGQIIKRVQRYLGLRVKAGDARTLSIPFDSSKGSFDMKYSTELDPEGDILFICVDVELYEFNNSRITEVGIAILDTRLIAGKPPGEDYKDWFNCIDAHHFRIREYAHMVNRKHVKGCELFFDFGKSEMISLKHIPGVLESIFAIAPPRKPQDRSLRFNHEGRRIAIVGHDVMLDVGYLKRLGVHINPGQYEMVDTQAMYMHYRHNRQPTKLANVLSDMLLAYRYLHNGGNDAVYTLRAMVALAFRTREQSLERLANPQDEDSGDDTEPGWSTGGEDNDGGPTLWDPKDSAPRTTYNAESDRQVR